MANKNVFSRPSAKESHSRNSFDRSYQVNVNFSSGMMIPTFCKFAFGKSHVRINQRSFMRTSDIARPAFPSLPMYTDYYFVPMHQILSCWNDFRSRTNDRHSTRLGVPTRLPSFNHTDLFNAVDAAFNTNSKDAAGLPEEYGIMRLVDMLGYGTNAEVANENVNLGFSKMFNETGDLTPLRFCAYQKIYYDHYRNTAYEKNDVEAYNIDDLFNNIINDTCTPASISTNRLRKFTMLRYVNYRRDLFNTIYPSLNFISNAANGLQGLNSIPSSVLQGFVGYGLNTVAQGTKPYNGTFVDVNSPYSGDMGSVFSTQMLRSAFALEKLLRVSAFAPQHVIDQFEARFGYRPRSASMHESVRLGSFKNDIICGEVTATANSTDSLGQTQPLGSVGGKGVGSADFEKVISYDVPEDGIIMGITYTLPNQTYDSNFVDPENQQFVPEDWSLPEYENLGLQPIFGKNLSMLHKVTDTADTTQLARGNIIIGYQPRDMQYKASVAVNHGNFVINGVLSAYVLHGRKDYLRSIAQNITSPGINYYYFKHVPQDLNTIFAVSADGSELKDQFYGNIVNSFACIQDKPIFGVPKL